jgi:hypothetical protein
VILDGSGRRLVTSTPYVGKMGRVGVENGDRRKVHVLLNLTQVHLISILYVSSPNLVHSRLRNITYPNKLPKKLKSEAKPNNLIDILKARSPHVPAASSCHWRVCPLGAPRVLLAPHSIIPKWY